ncbi:MAG: phosphoenolpyruvate synthase [Nitrosomonadales bacterium]|jgi:pyruvate,water dikinase|nr:phosphoenolpyruvate synthase [Nitrosomonadales bacterium]MBT3918035.1 phosphoenolpyruvate synthase [Nitrosomonadales bacterium]MBT4183296.1 phosphoenolpyruvate synthase [Nitrosomonadales bacterium]MBT4571148.1 phosphoenolpyruvate synthase [Nitrosomonadales bacterium]MBT4759427.1 phosphoenolpyruvate synthase [Nitrosomonadales bacterium]
MTQSIISFEELRNKDVAIVGGKNASLGEMISQLKAKGVRVPTGFATTADAFNNFLAQDRLGEKIEHELKDLDVNDVVKLADSGKKIRKWILDTSFSQDFEDNIKNHYDKLLEKSPKGTTFAVRSSATAEDLPDASFAGQQESFLNIHGIDNIRHAIKEVFASLYNDRAISYRVHKNFVHSDVAISAGIQQMVRSDMGSSGVMFTIDTESGFKDVIFITSSYGLGETVVQGAVNPDEFYVHKSLLNLGKNAIVRKSIGSKKIKMVFSEDTKAGLSTSTIDVEENLSDQFSIKDEDVTELANYAMIIESHYGCPMDIEWGRNGLDGKLYILQARPETVKSQNQNTTETYTLKESSKALVAGRAVTQKIGVGPVRIVKDPSEMHTVQPGDVLVADMTDPNWEPVMKRASALVTNRGGRTCHAAIIARELGIPAIVGSVNATELLTEQDTVTVSCSEGETGIVYQGKLDFEIKVQDDGELPKLPIKLMMNVGNPDMAFTFAQIPNDGVGLARLEFVINNMIGIHPKAILNYKAMPEDIQKTIDFKSKGYASPKDFYVNKVTEGVATIASAFYPKPVIVRMSDFKSNEYKKLVAGDIYEPDEENPMIGFRGAARYISDQFKDCFKLECEAMLKARNEMGLTNIELMIPFVRTLKEAEAVINILEKNGLKRGENGLRLIMMCEVPSNAILAKDFLNYFDGFSIGSNDLTQLTLGTDRDSGILADGFDERDPAVIRLIELAIEGAKKSKRYVGICGQGPSDHPDFAKWLLKQKMDSMSLNPDTVISTWKKLSEK